MTKSKLLIITGLLFAFQACEKGHKFIFKTPKEISVKNKLTLSVSEESNKPIDSIWYYLDGKRLKSGKNIDLSTKKLGRHKVTATVFYDNKQKQLINTFFLLNDKKYKIFNYEIVNEYPHDPEAFTQGLEYHDGFLYESTGQRGKSSLRKVKLETGEVLRKVDIDKQYFAEGMTIFNNKIYLLTWQHKKGFVYDLETFAFEKEFNYQQSKEGWGLTHTKDKILKSDGTEKIWTLNPETLKEESYIESYTDEARIFYLNELEYINDKIYANRWQKEAIAIINPKTGAVEGVVKLKGLQEKAGEKGEEKVLNGIAYDSENNRIFVTGKNWSKLYEIKIID